MAGYVAAASGTSVKNPESLQSSRSLNTVYTNNTGGPLFVCVELKNASADGETYAYGYAGPSYKVDATRERNDSSGDSHVTTMHMFVPEGETYEASSFGVESIFQWTEQEVA